MNKYSVIGLVWASVTLMAQTPAARSPHQDLRGQSAKRHAQHQRRAGRRGRISHQVRESPRRRRFQAKQAEITDLNDKLQRGANTLSQTAQDDLKKSLDRKNTEYKRAVEDYQFDRDEEQRKLLDDLSAKMQSVIARYRAGKRLRDIPGRDQPELGNHVDCGSGRRDAADRGRLRQGAGGRG